MAGIDDYWFLDKRSHTKRKLGIFNQYFTVWLTIWNNQNWTNKDWYYLDLFAGRGEYFLNGKSEFGTPLLFLNRINELIQKGKLLDNKIRMLLIEKDKNNYRCLREGIEKFTTDKPLLSEVMEINCYNDDCNVVINDVLSCIHKTTASPLLTIIDPYGIKTTPAETIKKIVSLPNPQDIFFNYILEGVRRTAGIAKKAALGNVELTKQEITTIKTLHNFFGKDIDVLKENDDLLLLETYTQEVLNSSNKNKIIAFNMPYHERNDIIYYLLFACKKDEITKVVKDIYGRQKKKQKEESGQLTLFGHEFYQEELPQFDNKKNSSL